MRKHHPPSRTRLSLGRWKAQLLSPSPASALIRETARRQWKLLALNLGANLTAAVSEGATLAVIFLAVQWLSNSSKNNSQILKATEGLGINSIPGFTALTNNIDPTALFVVLMVVAVALQSLYSGALFISKVSMQYFSARCKTVITAHIHKQILSFTFPCASKFRVGDLSDQIIQGPNGVALEISLFNEIVLSIMLILVYLFVLLKLSAWLMISALLLGGAIAIVQKIMVPRIRHEADRISTIGADVSGIIIEDFQGLRVLHSSGLLSNAINKLIHPLLEMETSMKRKSLMIESTQPITQIFPILGFAIIAIISVAIFHKTDAGVLPNLVTFMLALQRLNMRLQGTAVCVNMLSDNHGKINRLNIILDPKDKQFRRTGGKEFQELEREIRFQDVSLIYDGTSKEALQKVSFTLPKGTTVALVGGSGAGKSSIADLLAGLYSPGEGKVLIDDQSLESLNLTSWQNRLGVVSQDTFLFNASLAENIAYGCPWASKKDIADAADRAQALEFIASLPEGMDTRLGERGYRLSGGQRQRISLARAILRRPDLLILDEATSALDTESERLVQQAIEQFNFQTTTLIIAHRLSTIINADQILVLEKGKIVERGNHEILMNLKGRYSVLWDQQSSPLSASQLAQA